MTESIPRVRFGRQTDAGGWLVAIALAMVLCIPPLDIYFTNTQISILYVVPLTLLAFGGRLRPLRWLTLVAMFLTVATYFIKYWWTPPDVGNPYWSFRILNRGMVLVMLWLLSRVMGLWVESQHNREDPMWADELDLALHNVSALIGMLIAMPVAVAVAVINVLTPGNFNLSVLYIVPLVTSAWVGSKQLLWAMFVLMEVFTFGCLYCGPAPNEDFRISLTNRAITGVAMLLVTALLHYRISIKSERGLPGLEEPADRRTNDNGEHLVAR